MNEIMPFRTLPSDIDPLWAGDGAHLPEWFVSALAVPRQEGFIEIDGARVHYMRWGERGKPKVLTTHGFLSHVRCFAFIAPFLAGDYDIVAFDLAGMGDSDMRGKADVDARGREFHEIAEALQLFEGGERPYIVAHSFGSGAALTAVTQRPGSYAGLVICDLMIMRPEIMAEYWSKDRASPGSGDPAKPKRIYPSYEAARERYILSPPQPVGQPFLMDYMAFHSLRREGDGWTWKFSPEVFRRGNKAEEWLTMGERLVNAPGRKAIVHGEKTSLFTEDSRKYICELGGGDIPIVAVPDARHHLMLDQPLAFAAALGAILALWSSGRHAQEYRLPSRR
ncbi:alpha/beta hydrolase [Pacificimonas flava]|uniref:Alpha/beta hydrolase n=2 Tax=Pacificimonas TaxID=1960290 RepID=A0A219B4X9_9SPHN|nr:MULTISPECIES: alpha/beta hydrolase [Pacificimonas]MBZ6377117.1 alpha/beta hydrolase [Pacificimonas aurantium]OWV33156.1 alpha/beta hydrolase [Pacificimonas flava]